MQEMIRDFSLDGMEYRMKLSEKGALSFWVTGGIDKTGRPANRSVTDGWDDEAPSSVFGDRVRNPVKTLREAERVAIGIVAEIRPNFFTFGTQDLRRIPLYIRFAKRLSKILDYAWHQNESAFYFYRDQSV